MSAPEPSHPLLPGHDARRTAPSAARNRAPLLAQLQRLLPSPAQILEVASGSGEHALWFSTALPHLTWQPTDADPAARASIDAWRTEAGPNLLPALPLDAASPHWPVIAADAVLSVNMIHIAPWPATEGLLAGAARILPPTGRLLLYGPFREGPATTPGNAEFDTSLRTQNPAWGVRELDAVLAEATRAGLHLTERVAMPAHNLLLVFQCAAPP